MVLTEAHRLDLAVADAATDAALTPEQLAAVRAKVEGDPEYAGLNVRETLARLATRRPGPNPEPQGDVPRAEWLPDELVNALLAMPGPGGVPLFVFVKNLAAEASEAGVLASSFLAAVDHLKSLDLANPLVAQGFAMFRDSGLLTTEQYDALTTMPDPAWQADVYLPSDLEACGLPYPATLTARDLAEALA